jgi:hypothetical protein
MRRAPEIKLNEEQHVELVSWSRSRTLSARQVSCARILLLAAGGQEDIAIAKAVGCVRQRCARVRQRFLRAHLQHGQTRLDTNVVENHIRPTALGKKNWLFIGHPEAGRRTAILYSPSSPACATATIPRPLCATCSPACPP